MYSLPAECLYRIHILVGWISVAAGILSGGVIGMCFHKEDWLGGYGSVSRRLIRLSHISFLGMAFMNFSYAMTLYIMLSHEDVFLGASIGLVLATISMPVACFLSALTGIKRLYFVIPVSGTLLFLGYTLLLL